MGEGMESCWQQHCCNLNVVCTHCSSLLCLGPLLKIYMPPPLSHFIQCLPVLFPSDPPPPLYFRCPGVYSLRSSQTRQTFMSKLYVYLTREMHAAINKEFSFDRSSDAGVVRISKDRLFHFANESEVRSTQHTQATMLWFPCNPPQLQARPLLQSTWALLLLLLMSCAIVTSPSHTVLLFI